MLNGLDLFSGIGGLSLALQPYVDPVAYCENDRYAQAVLLQLMWNGNISVAPIWNDVSTLRAIDLGWPDYEMDIIYGGFPCQDISLAGTGEGLAGKRSGLIFDLLRLVGEMGPRFIFLENVPVITHRGLGDILGPLASMGYHSRWTRVSAAEIGAVHIRERWFLLAHSNGMRLREECLQERERIGSGPRTLQPNKISEFRRITKSSPGFTQPRVDRTGDGLSCRMDRHHGLGNAVVPAQAREAFERLMGLKSEN